jgi:NADPH:quinone reductase-like Zn-dependent oxidoreductase
MVASRVDGTTARDITSITKMKALRFDAFGPPTVLSLEEISTPDLKPDEALIELHAAAINPSDVKNVAGAFKATLPRTPGRDYAGVVVSGDGWRGKQVWGSDAGLGVSRDGTHAQYVIVNRDSLSEMPPRLSMEEASSIGVPYLAAWSALITAADIKPAETALITGALGAVGRAAIQIAHWKGARVIGADIFDRPSNADVLVNTKSKDLTAEVKSLTGGHGADLVLDAVGGVMFEPALKSLRTGGRQVAITSAGSGRVEFNLIDFYHQKLRLIGVDTMKLSGQEIAAIMDGLHVGFEEGKLQPSSTKTWTLDQAADAYTAVAKGDSSRTHVLLPRSI